MRSGLQFELRAGRAWCVANERGSRCWMRPASGFRLTPRVCSRWWWQYLGGKLDILTMEGHGVDSYLYLARLGAACETLPAVVRCSPAERESTPSTGARRHTGVSLALQWRYIGVTLVLHWRYIDVKLTLHYHSQLGCAAAWLHPPPRVHRVFHGA